MSNVAGLQTEVFDDDRKSLWVFAYGSLCWRPGFTFSRAVIGCVKGYQRRFWQGNTTHRGTEDKPGRVATLIEDRQGIVQGVAFAISGDAAIPYLSRRECEKGGYITQFSTFFPRHGAPFNVLLYVATPDNPLWMGHTDEKIIAEEIIGCRGASGHNVEYLIRLADFIREHFSEGCDPHLFTLEKEVLDLIDRKKMCLKSLMGNGENCISFVRQERGDRSRSSSEERDRSDSFEYTSRIIGKTLRCVNP